MKREPSSGRHIRNQAGCMSVAGYALIRSGERDRGMEILSASRTSLESLTAKEPDNEAFRYQRAVTTAIQAMAFAALSQEASASSPERLKYLTQAEAYLAEAEEFTRIAKSIEPEAYLKAARADVAAAKAKLTEPGN